MKSAYHLARKDLEVSDSAGPSMEDSLWRKIWSLNLPVKIRVFLWRGLSGLLPTSTNLEKMKVLQDDECQRCHRGVEIVEHALFHWKSSRACWNHSQFKELVAGMGNGSLSNISLACFNNLTNTEVETVVGILWAMWIGRTMPS